MYRARNITVGEMSGLVKRVRGLIISSNHLLPRKAFPYYHSHPSVPQTLKAFKEKFTTTRMLASSYILEKFEGQSHPEMGDFRQGGFSHNFTASLAVGSLGMGECAECSDRLALEMILRGFGNLSIVRIKFPQAKEGMETGHQIIIANLSKGPDRSFQGKSIIEFIRSLPADAVIGDAFLGLSFSPTAIPPDFLDYVSAYGGEAVVEGCFHFTNLGIVFLAPFLSCAGKVAQAISSHPATQLRFYVVQSPLKAVGEAKKPEAASATIKP